MPPPFNIPTTSPAPSDLISAFPADEQANRAVIEDWLSHISDPTTGDLRADVFPASESFPSGTRMLFQQTAAPTGWTKDTTHNNKALRLTSGTVSTGGSVAFTTAFTSQDVEGTIGSTSLTIANLPAHTHSSGTLAGTTNTTGNHTHTTSGIRGSGFGSGSTLIFGDWSSPTADSQGSSTAGNHSHTVDINSGATGSAGSGTGHTHTFTGTDIDLRVQYVDFIIAEKD